MKLKYLIIISLILTILTISTVSASEDANNTLTIDSTGDNQVTEIQNDNSKQDNLKTSTTENIKENSNKEYSVKDEIISTSNSKSNINFDSENNATDKESTKILKSSKNDDIIKAETRTVTSYTALKGLLEGYTGSDLTVNLEEGDYSSNGRIEVNEKIKNLIINGNDRIIDGLNSNPFLDLGDDHDINFILKDITVQNCKAEQGSAINQNFDDPSYSGSITITNSKFINNIANAKGGAIYQKKGKLIINDSLFEGNTASDGGAIYHEAYYESPDVGAELNRCNFTNNAASEYGGAIYIEFVDSKFLVNQCNFTGNKVISTSKHTEGIGGGAIYQTNSGLLDINNSKFDSNTITSTKKESCRGGAICQYFDGGNHEFMLRINNSIFTSNKIDINVKGSSGLGGAIYQGDTSEFIINSTNFINNELLGSLGTKEGGAIWLEGIGTFNLCNFTNNSAKTGGAISFNGYDYDDIKWYCVENSKFENNTATANSGFVLVLVKNMKIINNIFINNTNNNNDMLFSKSVDWSDYKHNIIYNNIYLDNCLSDTLVTGIEPIILEYNQKSNPIHFIDLNKYYNSTVVNGTLNFYYNQQDATPFATFPIVNGDAILNFTENELDKGENTIYYGYTSLSKHYQNKTQNSQKKTLTIKMKIAQEYINVNVTKVWKDNNNQDGTRPSTVTVNLTKDCVFNQSVELNADHEWKYTFPNLPKYHDDSTLINYNVVEEDISGYLSVIETSNNDYNFTITNSRVVNVNVTKIWDDNDNQDGMRSTSVTVNLTKDGEFIESVELNADNEWKYTFPDLPKYDDNGRLIVYNFTESPVDGYTRLVTNNSYEYTVTNTHAPELINIEVVKFWDDNNDQDGIRPNEVSVNLTKNGVFNKTIVLNASNNWQYTVSNMPKYSSGKLIIYTIIEPSVEGYMSSVTNDSYKYILTNTHIPEVTDINVVKVWDDNNRYGNRPTSITVNLTKDGNFNQTVKLNASNNWYYTFTNMSKYDNGRLIIYNFTENELLGYTLSVTNDSYNYTLTNIYVSKTKINCTVINDIEGKVSIDIRVYDENDDEIPNSIVNLTIDEITSQLFKTNRIYQNKTLEKGYHTLNITYLKTKKYAESNTSIRFYVVPASDTGDLQDQIDKLKENITALNKTLNQTLIDLKLVNEKIENLTKNITRLNQTVIDLENRITQLEGLQAIIDDLELRIIELEKLKTKIIKLENKIIILQNKITELEKLKDNITTLENRITQLENQLDKNSTALLEAQELIKQLQGNVSKLENQLDKNSTALLEAQELIKQLQNNITILNNITYNLNSTIKNQNVTKLENKLNNATNRIESLEGQIITLQSSLTEAINKINQLTNNTTNNDTNTDSSNVSPSKTSKQKTKIIAKKKTFKRKIKTKKYKATLKSGKKRVAKARLYLTIKLKIKGQKYKVKTNNKGIATFKITKSKKKGKYKATIKYKGNKKYRITVKSGKKRAKKVKVYLTLKGKKYKKTFKAKTNKKGKATIKINNLKKKSKYKATIKYTSSKTYKAKTNKKGKATFKIKKLTKKGKYRATIKYKGNKKYKASKKTVKITIK